MNASQTDSDQYALSTHVAADHSLYHVSIDAGHNHVAYADIRPTSSNIELSIDVATGTRPLVCAAASSTRVRPRGHAHTRDIVGHLAPR
jgi:hypothetical protein